MTDAEFDALADEVAEAIFTGNAYAAMQLCTGLTPEDLERLQAEMEVRGAIPG